VGVAGRLMETDYYATMLVPPFHPGEGWAQSLAESLIHPEFSITFWEAFGRRFRRNYWPIFAILGLSWVFKNLIFPDVVTGWDEFVARAAIGPLPGWLVLGTGLAYNALLFVVGFATSGLSRASGEVLPKYSSIEAAGDFFERMLAAGGSLLPGGAGLRRHEH
jgi:uncharacterized membrane protein